MIWDLKKNVCIDSFPIVFLIHYYYGWYSSTYIMYEYNDYEISTAYKEMVYIIIYG